MTSTFTDKVHIYFTDEPHILITKFGTTLKYEQFEYTYLRGITQFTIVNYICNCHAIYLFIYLFMLW